MPALSSCDFVMKFFSKYQSKFKVNVLKTHIYVSSSILGNFITEELDYFTVMSFLKATKHISMHAPLFFWMSHS
jgi:hypothetical protein